MHLVPYVVIPIAGYVCLWLLGIILFLAFFTLYDVPIEPKDAAGMLQKLPAPLSIATVVLCSAASFYGTTKAVLTTTAIHAPPERLVWIGAISLACTIVLDILITVIGERIDIRMYPLNVMYAGAWLVIIPSILIAGLY